MGEEEEKKTVAYAGVVWRTLRGGGLWWGGGLKISLVEEGYKECSKGEGDEGWGVNGGDSKMKEEGGEVGGGRFMIEVEAGRDGRDEEARAKQGHGGKVVWRANGEAGDRGIGESGGFKKVGGEGYGREDGRN